MIYKYAIDFGTTNSSVAIRIRDSRTQSDNTTIFEIHDGRGSSLTMPSVIYVDENTKFLPPEKIKVGFDAKEFFAGSTSQYKQLVKEIKLEIDRENESIMLKNGDRVSTVTLVAAILYRLKAIADEQLFEMEISPRGVVMGVPVSFSDKSKALLREALVKAGFYQNDREARELTEFVSEPVAVAVAYGVTLESKKQVMVFDFGGGTLDIAVLRLNPHGQENDTYLPHDVLAKERLTIGGERINKILFEDVFSKHYRTELSQYSHQLGLDAPFAFADKWGYLSKTSAGFQLQDKIEEIKCELSLNQFADGQFLGRGGVSLGSSLIGRTEFESALEDILDEIRELVEVSLNHAGLEYYDIDDVLLAGGSSLLPCIQDMLIEDIGFGNKVHGCTKRKAVPRDVLTSIVRGLSVYGCKEEADTRIVDDIVDHDYGVWDDNHNRVSVIVPRGTRYSDTDYNKGKAAGGCNKDYNAIGLTGSNTSIPLKVYEVDDNIPSCLGTIILRSGGSGKYRIFMRIDEKSGCLVVDVFDRLRARWYDDIPLADREFEIENDNTW